MKRKVLHKTGFLPLCAALASLCSLGSCIFEEGVPCNNMLRVEYVYNMEQEDEFSDQASDLNVYVFDSATGLFVQEIDCPDGPYAEDFTVEIPKALNGKACDYVVWSGLKSGAYNYPQLQAGVSTKHDLDVQVEGHEERLVNSELPSLWHGASERVTMPVSGSGSQVHTVSLIKYTNRFYITLTFRNADKEPVPSPYTPEQLEVSILSASSWYGYNSVLNDEDHHVNFVSYAGKVENAGLLYELNTLRLMNDRENTLVVRDINSNKVIFEKPLNSYLDEYRLTHESWIKSLQEYLDREDVFSISLELIDDDGGSDGDGDWESFQIRINDWVIRDHNKL